MERSWADDFSLPPNCSFIIDDAEDPWTFSQKFDFIHGRALSPHPFPLLTPSTFHLCLSFFLISNHPFADNEHLNSHLLRKPESRLSARV